MNKTKVSVLIMIAIVFILYLTGVLGMLWALIPQFPSIYCDQDSDCKLHVSPEWSTCGCEGCGSFQVIEDHVIAMNRDWQPFCPFIAVLSCMQCDRNIISDGGPVINSSGYVKCMNNQCHKKIEIKD